MMLLNPDVLLEAKGLSVGASSFFLFVGLMLWAFGWRWHRFWVVFAITVAAGMFGLTAGRTAGTQVLVVGVLLAVAAGMLAIEIARILAFLGGGTAAWLAAANVVPQAQELWAVFLCGGLLGLALYKLWTMLASSILGTLIVAHSLLLLLEQLQKFPAAKWATANSSAINGFIIGLTVLGVIAQAKTGSAAKGHDEEHGHEEEEEHDDHGKHGKKHKKSNSDDLAKLLKKLLPSG
jgi:hypothetical protein